MSGRPDHAKKPEAPGTGKPASAGIGAHGAIGNLRTVALVSTSGTIDFMCHPNLDSPSIFCALLDPDGGGSFTIAPGDKGEWHTRQIYIPDTNIVITRFMDGQSLFEIADFMPITAEEGPRSALVRRVTCITGEVTLIATCAPRFDYGRDGKPGVEIDGNTTIFTSNSDRAPGPLRLRASVKLSSAESGSAGAVFTLKPGEAHYFILECGLELPTRDDDPMDFVTSSFDDTIAYWQAWSTQSSYRGRWREHVSRSALVLKLLSSAEHGSIAAAATFGLPESLNGVRNWDYRFCWIRDAAFATFALMRLGYVAEASHFNTWVARRAEDSTAGDLNILYRLDGSKAQGEDELAEFTGYRNSRPVRIGNAASDQLQLDIYGALFDSVYLADKHGAAINYASWERMAKMLNWVCENWDQPDRGIWEIRGEGRHFLSSRLMCWVALDRGLRIARKRSLPAENAAAWEQNRDLIYRDIHENFWNPEREAFVQYKGGQTLDASALLMPLVRFIVPHDPRWLSTQSAIERELVSDVLVRRYESGTNVDGLDGNEGAFTPCCFWLVECIARSGDVRRARLHFEKLAGYANELGLFSEELGSGGEQLGNTPQALTHLALISAALTLDAELNRGDLRSECWRQF